MYYKPADTIHNPFEKGRPSRYLLPPLTDKIFYLLILISFSLSLFYWPKQVRQQKPTTIFTFGPAASDKLSNGGLINTGNLVMVQI